MIDEHVREIQARLDAAETKTLSPHVYVEIEDDLRRLLAELAAATERAEQAEARWAFIRSEIAGWITAFATDGCGPIECIEGIGEALRAEVVAALRQAANKADRG